MVLRARDLAALQKVAESGLTSTCTIQTIPTTQDPYYGQSGEYVDTYLNVPCRLVSPASFSPNNEVLIGGTIQQDAAWTLIVKVGQPLDGTMQVVCNGHLYRVIVVDDGRSDAVIKNALLTRKS